MKKIGFMVGNWTNNTVFYNLVVVGATFTLFVLSIVSSVLPFRIMANTCNPNM